MPQLLSFGSYRIFFWSNEGSPIEPVHVHISNGIPTADATKIWLTKSGRTLLSNPNDKRIPPKILAHLLKMIEAQSDIIISEWEKRFGETKFYI